MQTTSAMSPTNCWNLRVTAEVNQGGRKYMEDVTSIQFERVQFEGVMVEYAAFAIYDGHGGKDAAHFARDHLLENLKVQKGFFSSDTDVVKSAISEAFVATHLAMWNKLPEWPKTQMGHPSTAGTTASLAIIRGNRLYVANVGDSMIVMGSRMATGESIPFRATDLTIDHKPELTKERKRIEKCGGFVMNKSGVNRVVWSRPKINHTGPIRRSTKIDKIPFLAVARSLGDLWSFNSELNEFVVSPIPDTYVYQLQQSRDQFVVLASDGLWNMIRPQEAVSMVANIEEKRNARNNSDTECDPDDNTETTKSPAHELVHAALKRWEMRRMRADNTSVIVVVIERKKMEKAKKKETYFKSWTSTKNPASTLGDEVKEFADCVLKNNETPPNIPPPPPLQDSSISSSSETEPSSTGPLLEPTKPATTKPKKQAIAPLCTTPEKRVTRSHIVPRLTRSAAKRKNSSGSSAPNSVKKAKRNPSAKKIQPRRTKSEGGKALSSSILKQMTRRSCHKIA